MMHEAFLNAMMNESVSNGWEIHGFVILEEGTENRLLGVAVFDRPLKQDNIAWGTAEFVYNDDDGRFQFHLGHYDMTRGAANQDLIARVTRWV